MRTIPEAFNEWMRLYTEEPERFEREFQSVEAFREELAAGREPTYGDICARFLDGLINDRAMFESYAEPPATAASS